MAIYYKGNFILRSDILSEIKFKLIRKKTLEIDMKIPHSKYKLTIEEKNNIAKYILSPKFGKSVDKSYIIEQLVDIVSNMAKNSKLTPIIYETIYDRYGNSYAREIISELIFPLFSTNDFDSNFNYSSESGPLYDFRKQFIGNYQNGKFEFSLKGRPNIYSCILYCIKDRYISDAEVKRYESTNKINNNIKEDFKTQITRLYNMNILNDDIKKMIFTSPPNLSNNQNNNNFIKQSGFIANNSHTNSIPSNIGLESLKNLKEILNFLSVEDFNLIKDMTNNNLTDINISQYINMTKEEKLEFLNNVSKKKDDNENNNLKNRPKVSLKKR